MKDYKNLMVNAPAGWNTKQVCYHIHEAWSYVNDDKNILGYKECYRRPVENRDWQCWYLDEDNQELYEYFVNFDVKRGLATVKSQKIIHSGETAVNIYKCMSKVQAVQFNTFCTINMATYLYYYGAKKIADKFVSYNCNNIISKIDAKWFDQFGEGTFTVIQPYQIKDFLKVGSLIIAAKQDYQALDGHIAPVVDFGEYRDKNNQLVKQNFTVPYVANIGAKKRDGYTSVLNAFYVDNFNDLDYFVYIAS